MHRFIFIFWGLYIFNIGLSAQEKVNWSFGANPYYGGVFRYKPEMPQLKLTDLHGLELYASKVTDGRHRWERLFNYPHIGFAASYFNYGLSRELGEVYSLTSYLDVTANNHKKYQWRLNIGTGFVYSTQKYNGQLNPDNKAISSSISYVLRGTIYNQIKLHEKYFLNINFSFRHFSNGRLNVPNNGMNFPIVGIGFRYVPNPRNIAFVQDSIVEKDPSVYFSLMGAIAWREVLREDYKHKAYSVSFYASRQLTRFNTLLLGIDGFMYDSESVRKAVAVFNEQNSINEEGSLPDDGRQAAVTVGTEILMGKMRVILQGGFYVFKPQSYYTSSWYQRYGFKYMLTPHIFPQVTLKAHSRTADMVEFGLGVTF